MTDLNYLTRALSVEASLTCPQIIAYAHALYFGLEMMPPRERAHHIVEIRAELDKLTTAVTAVEERLAPDIAATWGDVNPT